MSITTVPGRVSGRLGVTLAVIASAGLAVVLVIVLIVSGIIRLPDWGDGSARFGITEDNRNAGNCAVVYDALDPANPAQVNPSKEVPYAVGPAVVATDEAGIKAELQERRECGEDDEYDPELTATHYADWSNAGLTSRTVEYKDVDSFRQELIGDHELYASVITELESLENNDECTYSTREVPAGLWSVYVKPDGNGSVTTHVGTTSNPGTAIVFTCGDKEVMYRLNCGFQILHETPPPGLPECEENDCNPCPPDMPNGTLPLCKDGPEAIPTPPPGGGGPAPVQPDPIGPPAGGTPPPVYAPPPAPAPSSPPAGSTPDPAPAPSPEPSAPPPAAPETGCIVIPDVEDCIEGN